MSKLRQLPERLKERVAGGNFGGNFGATRGDSFLEVQIHPADIRKSVRNFFLSRRHVAWTGVLLALYAILVGLAFWLSPGVVRGLIHAREKPNLEAERALQLERLQGLSERLARFSEQGEQLDLEMQKILLTYGLSNQVSVGQGGYPEGPTVVPDSIRTPEVAEEITRAGDLLGQSREQIAVLEAFLEDVTAYEEAYRDQVRMTPSIKPLAAGSFVLTSPFGERISPFTEQRETHVGLDLAAQTGTPIYATADGVVVFAGRYPQNRSVRWWNYGNLVVLRHGDSFRTLYAHCHEVRVRQGQRVQRGDLIATVGNTGWSTSAHLHYEVRRRDDEGAFKPVDPRIYILDHRWDNHAQLLVRARSAPGLEDYEPLPSLLSR